jgi:hypothetical protein
VFSLLNPELRALFQFHDNRGGDLVLGDLREQRLQSQA